MRVRLKERPTLTVPKKKKKKKKATASSEDSNYVCIGFWNICCRRVVMGGLCLFRCQSRAQDVLFFAVKLYPASNNSAELILSMLPKLPKKTNPMDHSRDDIYSDPSRAMTIREHRMLNKAEMPNHKYP